VILRESIAANSREGKFQFRLRQNNLRLAQIKEFAHDGLKRIGLEVNQDKQESIFWPM
jgi:hypothetical protein